MQNNKRDNELINAIIYGFLLAIPGALIGGPFGAIICILGVPFALLKKRNDHDNEIFQSEQQRMIDAIEKERNKDKWDKMDYSEITTYDSNTRSNYQVTKRIRLERFCGDMHKEQSAGHPVYERVHIINSNKDVIGEITYVYMNTREFFRMIDNGKQFEVITVMYPFNDTIWSSMRQYYVDGKIYGLYINSVDFY